MSSRKRLFNVNNNLSGLPGSAIIPSNVRITEDNIERITEANDPRIIE